MEQELLTMNMNKNTIGKVNAKHGIFYFCHFDEYIGLSIREYGEYSELELKTILKFINEEDIVFDVGANIGCFSVPFAKKVGPNGKVYAFEPQPFINKLLKKIFRKIILIISELLTKGWVQKMKY